MHKIYMAAALTSVIALSMQSFIKGNDSNHKKPELNMGTDKTKANKELIRKLYENILNGRHLDQLKTIIDENYTGPRGEKGPEGFKQTLVSLITAFPDIKWQVEDLLGESNRVVIRWRWTGTFQNSFRGITPNQKQFTNEAIVIYELANGKAQKVWMQSDQLGFMVQADVIPLSLLPGSPKK